MEPSLKISPRYVPLYTPKGVELAEENYHYLQLDWDIPRSQAAFVCLDCWANHFSRETLQRIDSISREKIAPALEACRHNDLTVIHAPGPLLANRDPNHVKVLPEGAIEQEPWPGSPHWPPPAFKEKTGPFVDYRRPYQKDAEDRTNWRLTRRKYHPLIQPREGEPVIANGEELHRICADRGILFLFYVGFNINVCMVGRDYGAYAMLKRGYEILLLRDCTTGMEIAETVADLSCTRSQIATMEQLDVYTTTSVEFLKAVKA